MQSAHRFQIDYRTVDTHFSLLGFPSNDHEGEQSNLNNKCLDVWTLRDQIFTKASCYANRANVMFCLDLNYQEKYNYQLVQTCQNNKVSLTMKIDISSILTPSFEKRKPRPMVRWANILRKIIPNLRISPENQFRISEFLRICMDLFASESIH